MYEEKIINLVKEKARANKKEISKNEAETILKKSQGQDQSEDVDLKKEDKRLPKKKAETKKVNDIKSKSKPAKVKKSSKKVSKK